MKITNLRCLGKTEEDGTLNEDGGYITFVVDMDDGTEYDLTMSRNEACNFHFALGKLLVTTDFRFKSSY